MNEHEATDSSDPGKVVVVILNYCMGALAVDCLRSLEQEVMALPGTRVVVADNASPDESLEEIGAAIQREGWGEWASVLPLPENGGFAYGNNRAIGQALEDPQVGFVYLLNPDTLMHPDGIRRLRDYLVAHPEVGLAGARVSWPDGNLNSGPHATPSPLGEFAGASRLGRLKAKFGKVANADLAAPEIDCDWVSGAAFIVRREVFETVGLMDEGFFLYYEEVDFCVRVKRAGWAIRFLRDARVTHMEGQATGIHESRRRPAYWFESRRRFFLKTYGLRGLVAADLCWAAGRTVRALRNTLRSEARDEQRVTRDLLLSDAVALVTGRLRPR